jgi:mRNA interferase HicA
LAAQEFPIDIAHQYVYIASMKRKQLEAKLTELGWWLERHGGNHDIWTNGDRQEPIPRHNEINEKLARSILRKAKRTNP